MLQEQVERLCTLECELRGECYQPIPDQVDGDAGLEGITSDGFFFCYQCYADQDTLNLTERLRKQKKKITTDLGKLKKYKDFWESIFCTHKLRRWFLVTPDVPDKAAIAANGNILGIVEAKKLTLGPQNVLTQAERYSKGATGNPLNYAGYRVPFLYSTNGEVIWFRDARHPLNRSRKVASFHTPLPSRK